MGIREFFNYLSILETLQERELRRIYRPIQLYDTALQKEGRRLFHEQLLADTPEAKFNRREFVDRFLQAWDKRMEIREQARADLTPQEREQLDIENAILKLKGMCTMSSKINRVSKIFRDNEELFYELFLYEPEFTGPIADGWIKRDLKLEKAMRKIRRIQQSRGEDEAQETRGFTGSDLERILQKHAEDLAQEDEDEAQEW